MNRLAEQLMGGDHEVKVARALAWLRTLLWWLKNLPQQAHIFVHEMCVDFLMLLVISVAEIMWLFPLISTVSVDMQPASESSSFLTELPKDFSNVKGSWPKQRDHHRLYLRIMLVDSIMVFVPLFLITFLRPCRPLSTFVVSRRPFISESW